MGVLCRDGRGLRFLPASVSETPWSTTVGPETVATTRPSMPPATGNPGPLATQGVLFAPGISVPVIFLAVRSFEYLKAPAFCGEQDTLAACNAIVSDSRRAA